MKFILKFYLYLPNDYKVKKLSRSERLLLTNFSLFLLVMEFRFVVMLCSNLGNENSDVGHIKC